MNDYFSITFTELFKAHILDVHLPNIFMGIGASIEVPLITTLGRRISASPSQIATFVLISSLSRTALDIPCGILTEYVGVRNVMFASLLLNAVAAVIGLFIRDAVTLAIFAVLSGISLGGFFLSRHIFVAGITSKKYRGVLMSFLSGLLRWAHVIGPSLTGIVASWTGDVRYAFVIAIVSSLTAFTTLLISSLSVGYQQRCAASCSARSSAVCTPLPSEEDEPVVVPRVIGSESVTFKPLNIAVAAWSVTSSVHSVHPSMGADEEHHFRLSALWYTVLDYWPTIWRLGLYVILFGAVRSNRKLLLALAAMNEKLEDSHLAYLLSFSFAFSALLFPLGGILMDLLGRQYAMVPVAVGYSINFMLLPLCQSMTSLYAISAGFGIADALGCGLVMTLTADRAPKVYGAPFFGIMRTLADMGHVVGAGGVSFSIDHVGFIYTCYIVAALGCVTAVWGVLGVPKDEEEPAETPRLRRSIEERHLTIGSAYTPEQPLLLRHPAAVPPYTATYGTTS